MKSMRDSKGRDLPPPGSLSLGFDQDRDDAFLVNEIALAIADRTRHLPTQSVATGLLAVNEDCRITLPIFKQCLDTDDQELRKEMVHAINRSVRDLIAVASFFEKLPRAKDAKASPLNRAAWYPYNVLSVLACWHYYTADNDSPVASSETYLQSPLWGIVKALYDNADTSDLSLPETLSWAAGRSDVETIRDLMRERAITSREDIEYLLESQGNVTTPVKSGVL
jgi:hypothetical protein